MSVLVAGLMLNLHMLRCKHCRVLFGRLGSSSYPFLCRTGWRRVSAMLEASDLPVPFYPEYIERGRLNG